MKGIMFLMMVIGVLNLNVLMAEADVTDVGQGSLRCITGESLQILDFPLKHTEVDADISGFIARVNVTQHFGNDFDHAVEAVYVFPLPDNAAVDEMTMIIGDREIKGVIKKRDEAQQIYQQAKAAGQTASLLTQERPNIFTQSVANIIPGDQIRIRISYVQDLKYDDGGYEFNFPMVVGPRFIPGNPIGKSGHGWAPDTDIVPDASRITPPVMKPGTRSGHDIELKVNLDAGLEIVDLRSPSHRIHKDWDSEREAMVELDSADSIPNKDFILRYDVAGDLPESAFLAHADDRGGFFTLMIQPQIDFDISEVTPKEMIFVVDCSGSMSGAPMAQAKAAMKKCIAEMNPNDYFQVIRFSSAASKFSPAPIPNTPANVKRGLAYIDQMAGSGGTMMIEGIKAALDYPTTPGLMRIVPFMTDGYIGNETQILGAIEQKIHNARLFSLGVGTSVNHYLLDRMAETGRGFVQYVRPDEDTTAAVNLFYDRIRNPLLTDIRIDWNGLDVKDVYPSAIPDLFSYQPVILHGRYGDEGEETITIHAKYKGSDWSQKLDVELPEYEPDHDVLATLWARNRIKTLESLMFRNQRPETISQITNLALEYKLMSQYTAFVAVTEEVRRDPGGQLITVQVPVELPEMVRYEGVFGATECDELAVSSVMPAKKHGRKQFFSAAPEPKFAEKESRDKLKALGYIGSGGTGNSRSYNEPASQNKPETICKDAADMEAPEDTKDLRQDTRDVTVKLRMSSGGLKPDKTAKILEDLESSLSSLFKSTGSITCVIKILETGSIDSIEILKNTWSDEQLENRVKIFLEKNLKLDEGPGEIVIEITIS